MDYLRGLFHPPDPNRLTRNEDVEGLNSSLHFLDYRVRLKSAKELAGIGDVTSLEPLIQAIKDPDERVREASIAAFHAIIGRLKDSPDKDLAIKILQKSLKREKAPTLCEQVQTGLDVLIAAGPTPS